MRYSSRSITSLFLFLSVFTFAFMVSVGTPMDAGACVAPCDCYYQGCHAIHAWNLGVWECRPNPCVQPNTCTPYPPCDIN